MKSYRSNILWGTSLLCSLECKSIWNFHLNTMEYHNYLYANLQQFVKNILSIIFCIASVHSATLNMKGKYDFPTMKQKSSIGFNLAFSPLLIWIKKFFRYHLDGMLIYSSISSFILLVAVFFVELLSKFGFFSPLEFIFTVSWNRSVYMIWKSKVFFYHN